MKHLIRLFATAILIPLTLAACSTDAAPEPEVPEAQPEAPKKRKGKKKTPKEAPEGKSQTICMGKQGDVAVDVRVVVESGKITGGMLSYIDKTTGVSGLAQTITGTREGKVMKVEGDGEVEGSKQKITAVITQTAKGSATLKLNGDAVDGKLKIHGSCGED